MSSVYKKWQALTTKKQKETDVGPLTALNRYIIKSFRKFNRQAIQLWDLKKHMIEKEFEDKINARQRKSWIHSSSSDNINMYQKSSDLTYCWVIRFKKWKELPKVILYQYQEVKRYSKEKSLRKQDIRYQHGRSMIYWPTFRSRFTFRLV